MVSHAAVCALARSLVSTRSRSVYLDTRVFHEMDIYRAHNRRRCKMDGMCVLGEEVHSRPAPGLEGVIEIKNNLPQGTMMF